jgi:hypothetical protein
MLCATASLLLPPGWHLGHVEVVDDAAGATYYFPCRAWLDKKEGDEAIERLLKVRGVCASHVCLYYISRDAVQVLETHHYVNSEAQLAWRRRSVHGMSEFASFSCVQNSYLAYAAAG